MRELFFETGRQGTALHTLFSERCGAHSFGACEQYLLRDGKPWLPVMAEFHFTRYDCAEWELELRKIKAGGADIVATYLFWIFHEPVQGEFDFSGSRDIGRFLALCRKVGLYAFVRLGPWCHGECRNGGFPDWLQQSGVPLRGCDERYLALVKRLFAAYAEQLRPWLFASGGPVIGLQLENEMVGNAEYLRRLKALALACGMHTPLYTVTGWGANVQLPWGEALPVYGAYPAAPWTEHCGPLGPNENYLFSPRRNDADIGSDQLRPGAGPDTAAAHAVPFLTCEIGPGNQCTHHRRPVITALDAEALSLTKLGSGNNLPGYYMYHGGFNPPGGLYQESRATGYPNDVPVSSYDFQAPLGEYGQPRESFFRLKRLHQFVHFCGERLAAMPAFFPDSRSAPEAAKHLALRSDGRSGFLFFNTYQRGAPSCHIDGLQVSVQGISGETRRYDLPELPADSCGVFPLELECGGVTIRFMTMLPLWFGMYLGRRTLVCTAYDGIEPVLELCSGVRVRSDAPLRMQRAENGTTVTGLRPGTLDICGENADLRLIVLCPQDGMRFYPVETSDAVRLVLSDGIAFAQDGEIAVWAETAPSPEQQRLLDAVSLTSTVGQRITAANPYAPYLFADPAQCPEYLLHIPQALTDGAFDALFCFRAEADVVQLYAGQTLIADEFLRGELWQVSLRRLRPYLWDGLELRLKCSPMRAEQPVYLERPVKRGCVELELTDIRIVEIKNAAPQTL